MSQTSIENPLGHRIRLQGPMLSLVNIDRGIAQRSVKRLYVSSGTSSGSLACTRRPVLLRCALVEDERVDQVRGECGPRCRGRGRKRGGGVRRLSDLASKEAADLSRSSHGAMESICISRARSFLGIKTTGSEFVPGKFKIPRPFFGLSQHIELLGSCDSRTRDR